MRTQLVFVLLILISLGSSFAQAMQVPSSMAFGNSSFLGQAMGNTCYAFDLGADTLPCNPAFMAKERERQFKGNIFFGNNVKYTQEATDLLRGNANDATVQRLFNQKESSELESNVDVGFLTETFGIAYSPLRLNYYTLFHDQALPQVTLFASQEESLRAQVASYWANNFYWGLQLRYIHRKFIAQEFYLTDAFAENGSDLFQPREQNVLYAEPTVMYSLDDHWLRPEVSYSLVNIGFADRTYDEYPSTPQSHVSGSVNPDFGIGKLGVGFDYFWDRTVEKILDPFSVGAYYQMGMLKLFGSLGTNTSGLGFNVVVNKISVGLAYSSKTIQDDLGDRATFQRVYMLLGVEI